MINCCNLPYEEGRAFACALFFIAYFATVRAYI